MKRINIDMKFRLILEENGDALDSLICVFAAVAVTMDKIAVKPTRAAIHEGWISVYE
jgi:hypothetical protein